jgi:hypothetical protein
MQQGRIPNHFFRQAGRKWSLQDYGVGRDRLAEPPDEEEGDEMEEEWDEEGEEWDESEEGDVEEGDGQPDMRERLGVRLNEQLMRVVTDEERKGMLHEAFANSFRAYRQAQAERQSPIRERLDDDSR